MKTIKRNKDFLNALSKLDVKQRKVLLEHVTRDQRRAILEIIANVVGGNFPLTKKQKQALAKHKCKLRKICKSCVKGNKLINTNSKTTKNSIVQVGGALPLLLAPILPLIGKALLGGVLGAGASYATKKILDKA